MKRNILLCGLAATLLISGAVYSEEQTAVLANFENDQPARVDFWVYSVCRNQRPNLQVKPTRELSAGKHSILVTAQRVDESVNHKMEGHVLLNASFEQGKRYQLVHSTENNNTSVWIVENDTQKIVSDKVAVELKNPLPANDMVLTKMCKSTTT